MYKKTHKANQICSKYYFSNSNTYPFIEGLENQINNMIINQSQLLEIIRSNKVIS